MEGRVAARSRPEPVDGYSTDVLGDGFELVGPSHGVYGAGREDIDLPPGARHQVLGQGTSRVFRSAVDLRAVTGDDEGDLQGTTPVRGDKAEMRRRREPSREKCERRSRPARTRAERREASETTRWTAAATSDGALSGRRSPASPSVSGTAQFE